MSPRTPGPIATVTLSRRSLLEWLGRGAVLALGSELLAACESTTLRRLPDRDTTRPADAPPARDAGDTAPSDAGASDTGDARRDADAASGRPDGRDAGDTAADTEVVGAEFPFEPGPGGTIPPGRERTVDPQELLKLLATWELSVDGLVDAPRTLTFADLLALPRQDQATDLHCVEGWSVFDVPWNGVRLSTLLDLVRPRPEATHVAFRTVPSPTTGIAYDGSLPLDVAREPRTLLAYGIAGATLPLANGFPLRAVVPRLLGYKNVKYVRGVELVDAPVEGYWVRYGYPYAGEVPPERLREGHY